MKTKSILLLLLIASAMIQVYLYFCICVFVFVLILEMIQARPKHFLVETEDKNVADNAVEPPVDFGTKSGQTVSGRSLCWARFCAPDYTPDWWTITLSPEDEYLW